MTYQGPSSEDIDQFSDETGYCPDCGSEVYDQADICPSCGEFIASRVLSRPPDVQWFRQRWFVLVAIIALIAFIMVFVF